MAAVLAAVDWSTVASLATAVGTLILALATFAAIRSSHASARTAERALLAGLRPVLFPSRDEDPIQYVSWINRALHAVPGGQALVADEGEVIYFAINLRNVGAGIAVLHGWRLQRLDPSFSNAGLDPPPLEQFRRQARDLFVPPEDTGFWQGAVREADDADRAWIVDAIAGGQVGVDLLYGDLEGGQRTISRFSVSRRDDLWRADVVRHWQIDGPNPR